MAIQYWFDDRANAALLWAFPEDDKIQIHNVGVTDIGFRTQQQTFIRGVRRAWNEDSQRFVGTIDVIRPDLNEPPEGGRHHFIGQRFEIRGTVASRACLLVTASSKGGAVYEEQLYRDNRDLPPGRIAEKEYVAADIEFYKILDALDSLRVKAGGEVIPGRTDPTYKREVSGPQAQR